MYVRQLLFLFMGACSLILVSLSRPLLLEVVDVVVLPFRQAGLFLQLNVCPSSLPSIVSEAHVPPLCKRILMPSTGRKREDWKEDYSHILDLRTIAASMVFFTVVHSAYTHIIRLEGNIRTFDIDKSFSSDDSLAKTKSLVLG